MELKWLEDLVALADAETLTLAAERRNVTQPAFSRRIKAIEDWLGAAVVDRAHKPARVTSAIRGQIETMRSLAHNLRHLRSEIQAAHGNQRRLVLASQHTISVFYLPAFFARFRTVEPTAVIRFRSANRDECRAMLMTKEAMITVVYETSRLPLATDDSLLEKIRLGGDLLVPVARVGFQRQWTSSRRRSPDIPIIAYPLDVFFGAILHHDILPSLSAEHRVAVACETALVPAVTELAIAGVGVAWLPQSAAARPLAEGKLESVGALFGTHPLDIVAARLRTPRSQFADFVWGQLQIFAASSRPKRSALATRPPASPERDG
jgi:DNA-binding transcriptional LysR family regulator